MAKKTDFGYLPYIGPEGFVFLRAFMTDDALVCHVAEELADRDVRVFYECAGAKDGAFPEEVAAGVQNCEAAFFVLTRDACESLDFRNSINYALKEKKTVVIIKRDSFVPGYGLDMQLANMPTVTLSGASEIADSLEKGGFLPDSVKGPGLVPKPEEKSRRKLSYAALLAIAIMLIVGVVIVKNRVDYLNSAEYQLRDVDNAEYVDVSRFDDSALALLDGKTIVTLNMENMGAKDISALSSMNVTNVDIAHNPDVASLDPLLDCGGIESVTVSQDMLEKAKSVIDAGLEVKVVS